MMLINGNPEDKDKENVLEEAEVKKNHLDDLLDDQGRVALNITPIMRSQARTLAVIMDEALRRNGRGESEAAINEVLARDYEYITAFAMLLKYTTGANKSFQLGRYEMIGKNHEPSERGGKQFRDNMKLLLVDELAHLIKEEADQLAIEKPGFIPQDYYAPKIRDRHGNITRIDQDGQTGNAIAGSPAWAVMSFAVAVSKTERKIHAALTSRYDR